MNLTNTQFKTADTQYILLLRVNTQFHKNLTCFSSNYKNWVVPVI